MSRRVISFDLDGTLVFQDKKAKRIALCRILEDAGYAVSLERVASSVSIANRLYDELGYLFAREPNLLIHEYARLMASELGYSTPQIVRDIEEFHHSYERCGRNFLVPAEAVEVLESLRVAGLDLVIISANLEAECRLQHCGILEMFQRVLSPRLGYPKAALFGVMLDAIDIAASSCLHVGDDPILDVLAPSRYGVQAFLLDQKGSYGYLQWPNVCTSYRSVRDRILDEGTTIAEDAARALGCC